MKYKILAILWMVGIFVSSSIPSYAFPEVSFWGWAKLIHLIYFGVLCFLIQRVLRNQKKFPYLSRNSILFAILFAACYGMTDEFHQLFTPGRNGHVTDVLVDALGACLFVAGAKAYESLRLRRADPA
jgi:VanZ family protein